MSIDSAASATVRLARFAATTPLGGVPAPTRHRLKECLLDFVGNAVFAAVFAESSPAFRAGTLALGHERGDATVVGEPGGWSPMQAALLNGAYAHTLDFDDTNTWGCLHPGAPVIAAALAEAERARASGQQLLAALAVGYEVACRVGAALGPTAYDRGFHITGVAGLFGAVAAAGRIRGLDSGMIAGAFGLALSKAAASMQYLENGAWNKRLHPGFAAHDALLALAFAQAGVVGAAEPLDGRYGLLAGYTNQPKADALVDRLEQWWPSGATALKPFPCCRFTHGAIEAALQVREQAGMQRAAALHDGERLQVRLSPKAVQIVGEPLPNKVHAGNIVDAQFSVYFQVAVALLDGRSNWRSYERIGAADVDRVCSAIDVIVDPEMAITGAMVTIGSASARIDDPLGEDSRPFSGPLLRAKFDDLARPVYGEHQAAKIASRIAALEDEPDAATLIRQLRRSGTP